MLAHIVAANVRHRGGEMIVCDRLGNPAFG
jgi:hypothetical protein